MRSGGGICSWKVEVRVKLRLFSASLLLLVLNGCSVFQPAPGTAEEIPSAAGPNSAQPNLAAGPDGETLLSWIEVRDDGAKLLKFSSTKGDGWSAPSSIAEGADLLLNWADFPSLFALPGGGLISHWLSTSPDREGYSVNIALSSDAGKTWTAPITPHRDQTPTEHGFVSLSPAPDGGAVVLWLDSRKLTEGNTDDVALMQTIVGRDGTLGSEVEVDSRVCECCAPSSVATANGTLAVYRDRSGEEIRDIVIARQKDGAWSAPKEVFRDNWQIFACPINGPAIAADQEAVAVAWFTAANGKPKVQIAFSEDEGNTFGAPVQVDDGSPVGRVDVALLPSGTAVVTWIEHSSAGGQVRARQIEADGTARPSFLVGATSIGTASGFPRVERAGETVVFAWTDTEEHRVRTAILR